MFFHSSIWKIVPLIAGLCACVAGCQVLPPPLATTSPYGEVRADNLARAEHVAGLVAELVPRIQAEVPDTDSRDFDVWIQRSPALYRGFSLGHQDADGFWAEGLGRIHLRAGADHLRRTLAHELVHAMLGDSWELLPGTIEEGLCDVISSRLSGVQAQRMRTGRLSSAALCTGGLLLEVEVLVPESAHAARRSLYAEVRIDGSRMQPVEPCDIFERNAGLSSTRLETSQKKAYYGLSFLLVQRIVDRVGLEGFHELCLRAELDQLDEVPAEWLLDAADLGCEPGEWNRAVAQAFGTTELYSLVRMHPSLIVDVVRSQLENDPLADELCELGVETRLRMPRGGGAIALQGFRPFSSR